MNHSYKMLLAINIIGNLPFGFNVKYGEREGVVAEILSRMIG